jgi:CheY-like chemotaxis protein
VNDTQCLERKQDTPSGNSTKHILLVMEPGSLKDKVKQTLFRVLPGCVIREVEDDQKAFSLMTLEQAGLIVMDESVCLRGGKAFLNRLREDEERPELPVIFLQDSITKDLLWENLQDTEVWFLEKDCPERDIALVALWLMD